MLNKNLAKNLQVWGFESDITIFQDGSHGFGFNCTPVDVSCWEDGDINSLSDKLDIFLNTLPEGISLQLVQDITNGNTEVITEYEKQKNSHASDLAVEIGAERAGILRSLDDENFIPKHSLKVFVRRPTSFTTSKPKLFGKSTSDFQEVTETQFERQIEATNRAKMDIRSSLESLGLSVDSINQDEMIQLLYNQWNPDRPVPMGVFDPEDIRDSILFTDQKIEDDGFKLGKVKHQVLSLKKLPNSSFSSMGSILRNLPFGSRLFLTIHVPHQIQEIEKLQRDRRVTFAMVHGKTGTADIEGRAKLDDIESLLEELVSQGQKVFHVGFNILIKGQDETELEDNVAKSLMTLRDLNGAEAMVETLASAEIFNQIAIPNCQNQERIRLMKTKNLSDILPIFGPWAGTDKASIILRSRQGSLVKFDPFSKNHTNYNMIVSGGSGSGKSFLTNMLLLQMLKEDPKIFIIDIGGSYKKLCDNLNGQYIPLAADSDMAVNPFDLLPTETVPSNQKIKFIVGLVELMTKENSDDGLNRYQRAEIEALVQQTYDEVDQPILSDLRKRLLKHNDVEIVRLGKILKSWCGDTLYGQFVDRPTSVNLNGSIISFDLKGMESYPDLQSVCLFLITDLVWREIQSDRSSMKFTIFDECWKLLENESGAGFIAEVFRTFRKYYASAIAISQSMDDFARSKVANAILSNSSIKWVLKQKGADQRRLAEVLRLNDNESQLVASLEQKRGHFSEAFLIAEDHRSVVAVEPFPKEYWLGTTDPRDLAVIEKLMSENANLTSREAIKKASEMYPNGTLAEL